MSQRTEKVGKLTRQILGELIGSLKDPRVGFATITNVHVSADLRHARVFVSVMGDEEEQQTTMSGLNSAKPYLRMELGRQLKTKYTPELIFELDHMPEEAQRLERIMREMHHEDPIEEEG